MISDWIQLIATIVAPITAVWFGAWLVSKSYYAQRRWEIQLEAYSNILNALYDMTKHSSETIEADIRGNKLTKDRKEEYTELYRRGEEELQKIISIGELSLPIAILNELRHTLILVERTDNITDYIGVVLAESEILHNGIEKFVASARLNLGLDNDLQFLRKKMRSD